MLMEMNITTDHTKSKPEDHWISFPRPAERKFQLGQVVATPNVLKTIPYGDMVQSLVRHVIGDWGILGENDRLANEQALAEGMRLLSAYRDRNGTQFWIITESDRSATTILLPEEY